MRRLYFLTLALLAMASASAQIKTTADLQGVYSGEYNGRSYVQGTDATWSDMEGELADVRITAINEDSIAISKVGFKGGVIDAAVDIEKQQVIIGFQNINDMFDLGAVPETFKEGKPTSDNNYVKAKYKIVGSIEPDGSIKLRYAYAHSGYVWYVVNETLAKNNSISKTYSVVGTATSSEKKAAIAYNGEATLNYWEGDPYAYELLLPFGDKSRVRSLQIKVMPDNTLRYRGQEVYGDEDEENPYYLECYNPTTAKDYLCIGAEPNEDEETESSFEEDDETATISFSYLYMPDFYSSNYTSYSGTYTFTWNKDDIVTGVKGVTANKANAADEYYTLDGLRLDRPQKGLNIVRTKGGKVKKVMM